MNGSLTIQLQQLRFFAHHGLYAGERNTGNEFVVDLFVTTEPAGGTIRDISETINYAALYELLRDEMQKPRELLETFVMETAELIRRSWPSVRRVDISIDKLHAPIQAFSGKVGVRYCKEF